jgi:hypothetical protein
MRLCPALLVLALVVGGCGGKRHPSTTTIAARKQAQASFRVVLRAPTHTPRVGRRWWYLVRATDRSGRPLRGRLTVEVVDPLGIAHAAEVGATTRKLVGYPFIGRYRDFADWPRAARGYRLVFRVRVAAGGATRTLRYWVRPE